MKDNELSDNIGGGLVAMYECFNVYRGGSESLMAGIWSAAYRCSDMG